MKQHRRPTLLLAAGCAFALLLLAACSPGQKPVLEQSAPPPSPAQTADGSKESPRRAGREALSQMMIDPPYDFDPSEMKTSNFGDFFMVDAPVTLHIETLLAGSPCETRLTVIKGASSGPTVFVVAGVHGDETAAWMTGNLLADVSVKAGTLCVISPANALGAKNSTRYVTDRLDLNRSFPGNPDGNPAEELADAIFRSVREKEPSLLLDLHEARITTADADYLGSSLIYSGLEGIDDLFFDILLATQTGELCSEPFAWYSPGPAGSINRTAAEQLNIPAITIETFRGYPLERRIADQLALVQYTLQYYGMV